MRKFARRSEGAFTLVEAMIASVSVGAVGLAIFSTLYMGVVLYSKNCMMNISHDVARNALMHLQQDIHSAASLPELTDSNEVVVSGTGPAAGVTFQVVTSGSTRCQIIANAAVGANQIKIGFSSSVPTPNAAERIIVPYYEIEQDISSVSISGTQATLTLSGTIGTAVNVSISGNSYNIPCFLTQRITYYVTKGPTASNPNTPYMLNYDGLGTRKSYPLTESSNCLQPFSLPDLAPGATYSQYVVGVNLYSQSPQYNQRGFHSADILITGQISPYAQLTVFQ